MSCGDPHETDCSEVLDRVYEYLDGELDAFAVGKISQHLDECAPCLSEYDLDVVLKQLVRRTCGGDCAPEELRTRIMLTIREVRVQLG
jgi:mycothiol system anti-sigma-R factor